MTASALKLHHQVVAFHYFAYTLAFPLRLPFMFMVVSLVVWIDGFLWNQGDVHPSSREIDRRFRGGGLLLQRIS